MTLPLMNHGTTQGFVSTDLPAFVMGIVNATPDSFWKESRASSSRAAEMALEMISLGADIIDLGGESSRPGSEYISLEEELSRVIPVLQEIRRHSSCPISIDTRKKKVMEAAFQSGADILNDISALEDDSQMINFVAEKKLCVILMHKRGNPDIMQQETKYNDVFQTVNAYLEARANYAISQGVEASKIIVDPGIGFGKDLTGNCQLICSCGKLCQGRFPVLIGLSRKSCLGEITGSEVSDRLAPSLAANLIAVQQGAKILRVHDVKETRDTLKVLEKLSQ